MRCLIVDAGSMDLAYVRGRISPERRKLSDSFIFEKDRRLSAAAGYMMACIEKEYGVSITVDADGKPQTDGDRVHFNISHSGHYAVCAISNRPVGIDIEQIGNNRDLAKAVMMPSELEIFGKVPDCEKELLFCRMWTVKESYMKAIGKGLSVPPETLKAINAEGIDRSMFCRPFVITELEAPKGYCISVCHDASDIPDRTVFLRMD